MATNQERQPSCGASGGARLGIACPPACHAPLTVSDAQVAWASGRPAPPAAESHPRGTHAGHGRDAALAGFAGGGFAARAAGEVGGEEGGRCAAGPGRGCWTEGAAGEGLGEWDDAALGLGGWLLAGDCPWLDGPDPAGAAETQGWGNWREEFSLGGVLSSAGAVQARPHSLPPALFMGGRRPPGGPQFERGGPCAAR